MGSRRLAGDARPGSPPTWLARDRLAPGRGGATAVPRWLVRRRPHAPGGAPAPDRTAALDEAARVLAADGPDGDRHVPAGAHHPLPPGARTSRASSGSTSSGSPTRRCWRGSWRTPGFRQVEVTPFDQQLGSTPRHPRAGAWPLHLDAPPARRGGVPSRAAAPGGGDERAHRASRLHPCAGRSCAQCGKGGPARVAGPAPHHQPESVSRWSRCHRNRRWRSRSSCSRTRAVLGRVREPVIRGRVASVTRERRVDEVVGRAERKLRRCRAAGGTRRVVASAGYLNHLEAVERALEAARHLVGVAGFAPTRGWRPGSSTK